MRFATAISAAAVLIGAAAPVAATFDFGNLKCSLGKFYWSDKDTCISVGGPGNAPSPPSGNQCPQSWFWHSEKNCCAPRYLPPKSIPSCNNGWVWNPSSFSCKPPSTPAGNNCGNNQWWWANRSCCLPHGGQPSPPLPPTGNNCPGTWYWNTNQGCCTPNHPPPSPEPTCPKNWEWNPSTQCCKPSAPTPPQPQPSQRPYANKQKRHNTTPQHKKKAVAKRDETVFCAAGLASCPVGGIFSKESECVDVMSELTSCGGCTSIGQGQDCSTISNMKVSSCNSGSCTVLACKDGFAVSEDQSSCVAL